MHMVRPLYATVHAGNSRPSRAAQIYQIADMGRAGEVPNKSQCRSDRLLITLCFGKSKFPNQPTRLKGAWTALSAAASSSGKCELLKKPLPSSKPAMAPAPSRGVMRMCQRKKEEARREACTPRPGTGAVCTIKLKSGGQSSNTA